MLEKIANLSTLRNLTGLSRLLLQQGNFCSLRCYSTQLAKPTTLAQFNCLSKPITFKNVLQPAPFQSSKMVGKNLVPTRSLAATHGDHVTLWKLERIVAAAFIPIFPLCFMMESAVIDAMLAILSVIHVHWGLEAIIVDYARPIVVGPLVPKVCFISLYLVSALTLAGLLVLIYNGPGIAKVIKQGWAIGKEPPKKGRR